MRRPPVVVTSCLVAAVAAGLLAACPPRVGTPVASPSVTATAESASPRPTTSPARSAGPARTATADPSAVAACTGPEPARLDPFPYNRDVQRRDQLLSIDPGEYAGGVAFLDRINLGTLRHLLDERFIDPYDRHNEAPTVWQFLQFMCAEPIAVASGYAVSIERADYRVSLDDIAGLADSTEAVAAFCVDADESEIALQFECFWD